MRLIDADLLADYITENEDAFSYAIEHKDRAVLEDAIASISTAYDVDNVVEELEKKYNEHQKQWGKYRDSHDFKGMSDYKDAIEIVRGGEND